MVPRLKERYMTELVPKLKQELGSTNIMCVPRLEKIVVNTSIKEAIQNQKLLDTAAEELAVITGQKALIRRARKSIANFKLREGMAIGNYSLGLTEQILFPEINYDKVVKIHGMNITFVTTAKTDAEARALLVSLGFPFRS